MMDIPGYEGRYAITENGEVWSYPKQGSRGGNEHQGVWMKPQTQKCGYYVVNLIKDRGKRPKCCLVHRLIAITYIANPNGYEETNHINGVKSDNRVGNIEWCDRSFNMIHAYRTGLKKPNVRQGKKLSSVQVDWIRSKARQGVANRELAKEYGTNYSSILNVVNHKSYRGAQLQ